MFSAARKSLKLWQSMTFFISWDLSGHFTHRYPSDSYPQTLEIRLHRITASSFLERFDRLHVISFWKLQFRGFFSLQLLKFDPRHKIVCLRYIVNFGYCFPLALKELIFSHLLPCCRELYLVQRANHWLFDKAWRTLLVETCQVTSLIDIRVIHTLRHWKLHYIESQPLLFLRTW